jgi:hypothetical protein
VAAAAAGRFVERESKKLAIACPSIQHVTSARSIGVDEAH